MKLVCAWLVAVLLSGCAAFPYAPQPGAKPDLFADARFPPPSVPVDADAVFALSPAMRDYLRDVITPKVARQGAMRGLVDALYTQSELKLAYDSTITRNAAEAFEARAGNCLSLVIMTAAFARELHLSVGYQKVLVEDALGRDGDIYFAIGHVNLTLGRNMPDDPMRSFRTGTWRVDADQMTIDFLPGRDLRSVHTRFIDESTVLAMYLNNRAVEALARGEVVDAYWWAREAVLRGPSYVPAVNTLGVIYARHQVHEHAERALRHVLERMPGNTQAMSNLVGVLAATGRVEESRRLAETLARIDPEPPFSWFIRGRDAMSVGDYATAKAAFAREVARAPDYHEFHFGLAAALAGLGEDARAREELALALETSPTPGDRNRYAAKLDRLRRLN